MARSSKADREFEEAKEEAFTDTEYTFVPDATWRERKLQWAKSITDELADIVFAMAKDGASAGDIAEFFGLKDGHQVKDFFGEAYMMGRADLKMRIAKRTVHMALNSKMPVGTIWAGKVFCGFSEQVAVDTQEDAAGINFNVNIIRRQAETYVEANSKTPESTVQPTDSTEYH